jgi:Ca2+-binding EF-hand superfamily protein
MQMQHRTKMVLMSGAFRSISFDELARGLSVGRFTGIDEMRHLFNQVDLDGSGALEFSEVITCWFKPFDEFLSRSS